MPVPILLAVAAPQVSPQDIPGAPVWASIVLGTVFVVLWFLNAIGRLPGQNSERRAASFTDKDRECLAVTHAYAKKVAELLGARDDDGLERYLLHAKMTKDTAETLAQVAKTMESVAQHMEVIAQNSTRRA